MTLPRADVVVLGVGARTATGLSALAVAMTSRAGKSQARECRFVDRAGEPMCLCRLACLRDDLVGSRRLLALGAPALSEAVASWGEVQRARTQAVPPLPAVVAVPEAMSARDARGFLEKLARDAGVSIALDRSEVIAGGRAGGAVAVARACERIARGTDDAMVVGGIDSFYDAARLEELDRAMRLHGPACENGFIPGEGAAFAVLGHRKGAGAGALAQIVGAATEREPRPYGSAEPCHGLGMTAAVKRSLVPLGSGSIGWTITDVVAERHRVEEYLYVTGRLHEHMTEPVHDQPLLRTGDLGAASGVTLLVLACVAFQTGTAKAPAALVMVHSDGAERGAFVVSEDLR